jgi:hypothetical protein
MKIRKAMAIMTLLTGAIGLAVPLIGVSGDSEVDGAIYIVFFVCSLCFSCMVAVHRWWLGPLLVFFCEFIVPTLISMLYATYFR